MAAVLSILAAPAWATESPHTIDIPVFWGTQEVGSVALDGALNDPSYINPRGLQQWVQENLSSAMQREFTKLTRTESDMRIETTEQCGFSLKYDEENSVFHIFPRPESLQTKALSIQETLIPKTLEPLKPAAFSAFLNARGGVDYVHKSMSQEGRQPSRMDIDGAGNLHGWVIEGRADYVEGNTRPWQRDEVRLVHDWPDKMVRGAVGDLSYPVSEFQNYQRMAGVSIARNFSLQPYRVTEPSGNSSFIIRSPSRVEILVNGQRIRTLQLNPGPYDISDFPVADGSNDVTMIITDATGNVETKTFPLLTNQRLLKEGLHEYSYNVGVESDVQDRQIEYADNRPAISAFHRYGISETVTAGASFQGDTDNQQAVFSAVTAHPWGTVGLDTGISHSRDFGNDNAVKLSYGYESTTERRGFSTSVQYRGPDFSSLGDVDKNTSALWEAAARYNQTIFDDMNMGIGGRYSVEQVGENKWSYSLNLSRMVSRSLSANVNFQHQQNTGAGVYVSLTWTPALSGHSVSTSYDSLSQTKETRWDWRDQQRWQVGAGVSEEHKQVRGTGNVNYNGQRMEASVRHDLITYISPDSSSRDDHTDDRSQILVGTAIAYADGHVALSRPITDSFVLLPRHENLKGQTIGINPQTGNDGEEKEYQGEIDSTGPAVLPDTVPYMVRNIRIDTQQLPIGYDIGQDNYTAMPSYKSGTVLTVGNGANIFADGYLQLSDTTPVILMAGTIHRTDGADFSDQEFFTNRQGRFRISQLAPGRYSLTLYKYPQSPVEMIIPDDTPIGRYKAGTLIIPIGSS